MAFPYAFGRSSLSAIDRVIATPDPPSTGVHNPIHDADGADSAGYAGALVAGVRTYGWAAQTIVKALGAEWLNTGWVDFSLKRPLYADETLVIEVDDEGNINCRVDNDGRIVLSGEAGLGNAPWLTELTPPEVQPAQDTTPPLPSYDLDSVPLKQPLVPLGAWLTSDTASALVAEDLRLSDPHYQGSERTPIHPYFIAGRMAPLTRHNFTYGPTIHVRSQIQHRQQGTSDCEVLINAQIVDAYERKGHWYQVLDGVVTSPQGTLAQLRHTTIFRPRGTNKRDT